MKLPWNRCFDAAVAAVKAEGIAPCDLAQFTAYDAPAYAPRRPTTTWNPPEYLDWWPKAERAVVEREIQTDKFWLDHGFRAYSTNHYVIRVLYEHGKRPDVVVGIWLAAAEDHLWRLGVWSPWSGDAAYVLPEQPEGFLVGVEPNLVAVTEAIIDKVVGVHDKYMLVVMCPKGPVIPNARAEQAAAKALFELTDEQFMRVVKAEADRRRGRGEPN